MTTYRTYGEALAAMEAQEKELGCGPVGHIELRKGKKSVRADRDKALADCTLDQMQREEDESAAGLSDGPRTITLDDVEYERAKTIVDYAPLIASAPDEDEYTVWLNDVDEEYLATIGRVCIWRE